MLTALIKTTIEPSYQADLKKTIFFMGIYWKLTRISEWVPGLQIQTAGITADISQ